LLYNYKTLKIVKQQGEKGLEKYPVFKNPGYQKNAKDLKKYALDKLINVEQLADKLDATNRIKNHNACEFSNLEHKVIAELLTSDILGPETLKGWFDSNWWLRYPIFI
jgi:hypothetical protein